MRFGMGRKGWSRGRGGVAAGVLVALAVAASGCSGSLTDTTGQQTSSATESDDATFSIVLGDLTEELGLSDDQAAAVGDVMEEYRGRDREAGALWYAAAELQEILTSEQIAAIEERLSGLRAEFEARRQSAGDRFGGRDRGGRGGVGGRRGGERPGGRIPIEGLDLSDEQLAELREIRESFAPEMGEIRDAIRDGSLSREEAAARMDAFREAMREAMQDVLTEEQLAVLEERLAEAEARRAESEERREEARAQREERREAEREAMIGALDLTPEQVTAIEALREEWPGDDRPSPEEIQTRREERHQALLEILDDDQEEIWTLHAALSAHFARHRIRARRDGVSETSGTWEASRQRVRRGVRASA
jgi:hypothetical protein